MVAYLDVSYRKSYGVFFPFHPRRGGHLFFVSIWLLSSITGLIGFGGALVTFGPEIMAHFRG